MSHSCRGLLVTLVTSAFLARGLQKEEGLATQLVLAQTEGSDGLGIALKAIIADPASAALQDPVSAPKLPKKQANYLTPHQWLEHHDQHHRQAHGKITVFKVIFGCCFLACLVVTCAFRACGNEPPAEAEGKEEAAEGAPDSPSKVVKLCKAIVIVGAWMAFSIMFIIYNKFMFARGGFPYPVTLTAMHMGSCYITFSCLRLLPRKWKAWIMPDADKHIPIDLYVKGLVPAALFYAVCLGIGNLGFLYATVAFIQMVKPVNIVVTSIAGFAWGLEPATPTHLGIAVMVSAGVVVAALGDVQFSVIGLICQLSASTCEGLRLIILQGIMQGSLKLDPLTTLYRFTPVAGLALTVMACFIESDVRWHELKVPQLLVLNCLMAIVLNILIAAVVHQTSAVVFVLAGVTKDVATIALSAALYRSPVTLEEVGGYAMSMMGIVLFKVYKDNLEMFQERGAIAFIDIVLRRPQPTKPAD